MASVSRKKEGRGRRGKEERVMPVETPKGPLDDLPVPRTVANSGLVCELAMLARGERRSCHWNGEERYMRSDGQ